MHYSLYKQIISFYCDLFIERIKHKVDARNKTWDWLIGLSPAETGAWILGVSKLGIDTNISYT